ncbi:MAG: hypothetical protein IT368_01440 [Candidatus Hydrogenedentes bacterium]|nr:hypothetical protein [Candidatus Hydrogenedentota bacterium]
MAAELTNQDTKLAMICPEDPAKARAPTSSTTPTREPDLPLPFVRQRAMSSPAAAMAPAAVPDEPSLDETVSTWNVRIPVFQWEIDPTDTERRCGSAELKYLGWEFRMWWEKHPVGLIYASIQATHGSREKDWQGGWAFPPERTLAVNLVYDEQRQGIVSIQGNARNLRPFIEAFLMGFGLGPSF